MKLLRLQDKWVYEESTYTYDGKILLKNGLEPDALEKYLKCCSKAEA